MVGGEGIKVNPAKLFVPPSVVTCTAPVEPPAETTAVICVAEFTTKLAAAVPPKLTPVAVKKSVPVITTIVPPGALVGRKPVTVGGGIKLNPAKLDEPPGVVT